MASGAYSRGMLKTLDGTVDWDTAVLKIMFLKSTYTYDPDHASLTSLTEITGVSGYTGGFAGSGRKTGVMTLTEQTASNRVVAIIGDLTWTALGTGDTIGGAALVFETGASDANSIPLCFFDFTDFPTNGSDVTLDFDGTNGNVRFAV